MNDAYETRPTVWEMAVFRAERDEHFDRALRLAGPSIVEVQCPSKKRLDELKSHPDFARLCDRVSAKASGRKINASRILLWFVPVALDPPIQELMTGAERIAAATKLAKHASGLRKCLAELMQENGTYCYPIQPILSQHAVVAAAEDYLRWKDGADGQDEELVGTIVHRTRFAIYDAIDGGLEMLLLSLEDAAAELLEVDTHLQRPSKANAKRLYFLRYMTNILYRETGKPCRDIVLDLAALYFDCDDLDEATISKLAPVN